MAQTYTVKSGDTKSALAKKFGVKISDLKTRSNDPNMLFAGETITLPDLQTAKEAVKDNIDLAKVQEVALQPIPKAPQSTVSPYTPTFVSPERPETPQKAQESVLDGISKKKDTLAKEISTIEKRISEASASKDSAYTTGGVYDDLERLNKLKASYDEEVDRETAIPIEARNTLRGTGATQQEFSNFTRPDLEQNALDRLTKSRQYTRYADAVNANIAQIDLKLKADLDRDTFLLESKNKRLETIEKQYENILTSAQAAMLEEKKFQNELTLEGVKSTNSIKKDLLTEIAKKGNVPPAELGILANGSLDDLYNYMQETDYNRPINLFNMSAEDAVNRLTPEEYTKWEKSKNLRDEDEAKAETQAVDSQNIVGTIDDLMDDIAGLDTATGAGFAAFVQRNSDFTGESNYFKAKAKNLLSNATLDTLKELKAAGATLGALSEKELKVLQDAGQSLGAIYYSNGDATGKFNLKTDDFVKEIRTMQMAAMKVFIASQIGKSAYQKAGYQGVSDFEVIQNRYRDLVQKSQETQDFSEELSSGLDLDAIAAIESGGDYNAVNPTSGAFGKYQFLPSTLKQVAAELGMTEEEARTPQGQEEAMAKFTENNIRGLQSAGIPVSNFTVYGAHQQGLGGFQQIVSGNVSEQVKKNMLANLPQSARKTGDVRTDWINYWQPKLS